MVYCRFPLAVLHMVMYLWASLVAQLVKDPLAMQETWVPSRGWEDPLEKGKATHSRIPTCRVPWTVHGIAEPDTTERLSLSVSLCHLRGWHRLLSSCPATLLAHLALAAGPGCLPPLETCGSLGATVRVGEAFTK